MTKVAIIMGSDSDWPVMQKAVTTLKSFGVVPTVRVLSAHRTPDEAASFAKAAEGEGYCAIIAAAGMAAHLAGAMAAHSQLPIIGVPMESGGMGGLDALLSTVMMPPGLPVATVAVGGAVNAAVLAVQIGALCDKELAEKLRTYRKEMAEKVLNKDAAIVKAAEEL
ncbi:MAG: 5-(carboxyamino)imidazole ribonucleotide mutase [Clostridiales bacterium]|nr:5-(carboxyamino)imidazole ribonucleotide mutase [Clostridiales bacterium]